MDKFLEFYNSGRYTFAGYQCFRDDMKKSFDAGCKSMDDDICELKDIIEQLSLELMYKNGQISRIGGDIKEYENYIDSPKSNNP